MATATMVKEKKNPAQTEKNGESENGAKKPGRRADPLKYPLSSDFLSNPRMLDFVEGLQSNEFAMEKCAKAIVEPLEFESEKEWLSFAREVWVWIQETDTRRKEALADQLLAQATTDEELLRILKSKLAALKS